MTKQRQHAYTTETEEPNPAPETSYAERARTMLSLNQVGVLSTHSNKCTGFPFGSTMPYALDDAGRPLFLISEMAMHTKNLQAEPHASLLVTVPEAQSDPLGTGRMTLIGKAEPVPKDDLAAARAAYLARHENAKYYVDFVRARRISRVTKTPSTTLISRTFRFGVLIPSISISSGASVLWAGSKIPISNRQFPIRWPRRPRESSST